MREQSEFKRVNGPGKTLESICINCLITVDTCMSDEDLAEREIGHRCNDRPEEVALPRIRGASLRRT
jgi:hypothetical protein